MISSSLHCSIIGSLSPPCQTVSADSECTPESLWLHQGFWSVIVLDFFLDMTLMSDYVNSIEHRLEAFKEKAQQERARLEALSAQEQPAALESDVALESDGTPGDVGVSDTQSSLSKVERRPRRAEVGQEEG